MSCLTVVSPDTPSNRKKRAKGTGLGIRGSLMHLSDSIMGRLMNDIFRNIHTFLGGEGMKLGKLSTLGKTIDVKARSADVGGNSSWHSTIKRVSSGAPESGGMVAQTFSVPVNS